MSNTACFIVHFIALYPQKEKVKTTFKGEAGFALQHDRMVCTSSPDVRLVSTNREPWHQTSDGPFLIRTMSLCKMLLYSSSEYVVVQHSTPRLRYAPQQQQQRSSTGSYVSSDTASPLITNHPHNSISSVSSGWFVLCWHLQNDSPPTDRLVISTPLSFSIPRPTCYQRLNLAVGKMKQKLKQISD